MDEYERKHSGNTANLTSISKLPPFYMDATSGELTDEELYAINKYISANSYILNEKLRNGIELSQEEQEWKRNLDYAIVKMPKYEGIVYRSLSSQMIRDTKAFNEKYSVGSFVIEPAYTSASTEVYDETMDIQIIIDSKRGADIRKYNPTEQEILFRRGSVFFVTRKEGNCIWMVEL